MAKRIIVWVLLLVLIAAGFAFWQYQRKPANLVSATPDQALTAAALTRYFEQDAAAADRAMKEKVLQVSGRVQRVSAVGAIVLQGSGASEVVVGVDERHLGQLQSLQPGSRVVVQGLYSGFQQSSNPTDLLAALGTTVQISAAGLVPQQ